MALRQVGKGRGFGKGSVPIYGIYTNLELLIYYPVIGNSPSEVLKKLGGVGKLKQKQCRHCRNSQPDVVAVKDPKQTVYQWIKLFNEKQKKIEY